MSIIAVLCAAPPTEASQLVIDHLNHHKIPVRSYEYPVWKSFADKVKTAFRACLELTEYSHILFIDAYDVLALSGPDVILERFAAFQHPWVCSAEINLWPPKSFPRSAYGEYTTPWRYLNSGMYLAERTYLRDCLERWNVPDTLSSDQQWYASHYLQEPGCILIDTQCELFQCLCASWWAVDCLPGQLVNHYTNTRPLLIHNNGGVKITDPRLDILRQGNLK